MRCPAFEANSCEPGTSVLLSNNGGGVLRNSHAVNVARMGDAAAGYKVDGGLAPGAKPKPGGQVQRGAPRAGGDRAGVDAKSGFSSRHRSVAGFA